LLLLQIFIYPKHSLLDSTFFEFLQEIKDPSQELKRKQERSYGNNEQNGRFRNLVKARPESPGLKIMPCHPGSIPGHNQTYDEADDGCDQPEEMLSLRA